MTPSIVSALINPNKFFAEKEKDPVNFKIPALIILANGLIAAISAYVLAGVTMRLFPAEIASYGQVAGIFGALVALVMGYLAWIIISALFYVLSMVFKGKGTFNRTIEYVGYGFFPQLIGGAIGAVLIYQFASTAMIAPISDMMAIQDAINALMKDPLIQLSTLVSAVFMVWSANIWIFGLKYARSLTTRSAALTVGLPVVLFLAYTLYTAVVA